MDGGSAGGSLAVWAVWAVEEESSGESGAALWLGTSGATLTVAVMAVAPTGVLRTGLSVTTVVAVCPRDAVALTEGLLTGVSVALVVAVGVGHAVALMGVLLTGVSVALVLAVGVGDAVALTSGGPIVSGLEPVLVPLFALAGPLPTAGAAVAVGATEGEGFDVATAAGLPLSISFFKRRASDMRVLMADLWPGVTLVVAGAVVVAVSVGA